VLWTDRRSKFAVAPTLYIRSSPHDRNFLKFGWNFKMNLPICRVMLKREEIDRDHLVKSVALSRIPAFPPVVLRALDLLSSDSTEIADLVREITSDATLSAHVLRLANSAQFGFRSQVDTVRHAVVALGISRVQSLILTLATGSFIRAAFRTDALVECWRHSLASAFISQQLARATGLPPDHAYTVALLHDIGRLGLLVGYPDEYGELISEADRDSLSLLDLEKRHFGMDHCEVGRILCKQWGLPQEFCLATGRHHDPPQGTPFDMLRVVHVSCQLADTLGYSAVTPLKPMGFDSLKELLPAYARERILESSEAFAQFVTSSMSEHETGLGGTPPKLVAGSSERDLEPAPESQIGLETCRREAYPVIAANSRITWDLTIILDHVDAVLGLALTLKYFESS
jgi:putative nucleotidyltransferase with HDIG domain